MLVTLQSLLLVDVTELGQGDWSTSSQSRSTGFEKQNNPAAFSLE